MEPLSADDPRQIGGFTLRSRLGAGGMGRVYLAFSPGGRAVAMKVVHPGLAADPEFLRRFRNEVAAARAVSGMYTAPVVGAGIDDDPPWLATAYVPGPPLADVVSRYGPLAEVAVWRLAAGLAEALRAVHACGLVHRDLKPGNVLLAADGPHVIDFGISRAFEGTAVTSTGMVVGTPGYMSPEQAEGQQAGPPSDVFSLGCVLAYAATAIAPFGGGSAASILYRVVTGAPDLGGITGDLRQVITACLVKNPAERIGLARLGPMIAALGPALSGSIGSFWPEPLAGIIAADHTHPVTQVSAPASAPPASAPASGQVPATGSPYGAAPVSQVLSAAPASQFLRGGAPVSPAPGLAQPSPLPHGVTGHAPMVADGYYAAAAYGMGGTNPAAGSPAPPGSAPSQPQYPQPQYGQASVEQARAPQYPASQQPATWQQPNAGAPQSNTPASQYAPQYGAPPRPQQASPASGPTTPWPQQASGGGSWPGSGSPSGPSGSSAATPLAQYVPGSGPVWRPNRAEIPSPVLGSIRLMYMGAVVTLADLIFGAVIAGRDNAYWLKYQHARRPVVRVAAEHSHTMAGALDLTTVLGGALGIVCWLVIARACRRGRSWTRIAATVLLGLNTASLVTVLLATQNDAGVKTTSLLVWIIGLAATIPLWGRQATNFFLAWRRDR